MASRNELVKRAEAFGLKSEDFPNDSNFEQEVLRHEAEVAPKPLKAGDMFNKLVKTGNGNKKWVTAATEEELEEQVTATQEEKSAEPVDINLPQ